MLLALLVGIGVGFVLAIPPGPVAGLLIQQTLAGRPQWKTPLGATLLDVGYAFVTAVFSSTFINSWHGFNAWLWPIELLFIGLLAATGIKFMFRPAAMNNPGKRFYSKSLFVVGMAASLKNLFSATLLPSLSLTAVILHARGLVPNSVLANVLYALAFGVGTLVWFGVLMRITSKVRDKFSSRVSAISRVVGIVFVISAASLAYELLTKR